MTATLAATETYFMDELTEQHRKAIGRAVKRARQAAGSTMRELAVLSGVSQPFLSMVENGRTTPSIAVLYRIAAALKVTPQELLGEPEDLVATVIRKDEARVFRVTGEEAHTNSALVRFLGGTRHRFEAYDFFDVSPEQDLGGDFTHEGIAFLMVINGSLRITFEGKDTVDLGEGDCIYYKGTRAHRWDVLGDNQARILLVIDRAGDDASQSAEQAAPVYPFAR